MWLENQLANTALGSGTSLQEQPRGAADTVDEQRRGTPKSWMSMVVPGGAPSVGNGGSCHVSGSWQGGEAAEGWLPALGLVALIPHMSPHWP